MATDSKSSTSSTSVSQDPMGKAATTNKEAEATAATPEKIKCDKNTSCDATYPWGSWK